MKVKAIVFCILLVQTSASFFDEFRGAMYSVENSFEKLVSDVVTDVKETIECTILAVKEVLALGRILDESSDYNERCRGQQDDTTDNNLNVNKADTTVKEKEDAYSPTAPVSLDPILRSENNGPKKFASENLTKQIDESIANVTKDVFNMIDNHSVHDQIEHARNRLKNVSNNLSDISALLRREWKNISEDVRKQFGRLEQDYQNTSVEDILRDIKTLHKIEQNHTNSQDAIEIRHILNEILSVLRGNNHDAVALAEETYENDTNKTFELIETQLEKLEAEERSQEAKIDNSPFFESKNDEKQEETKDTSRDVATWIMDETRDSFRSSEYSSQEFENLAADDTESVTTTEKTYDDAIQYPDYYSFLPLAPNNSDTIEEAKKLIESSKHTDAIMSAYLKKTDKVGTSVFDDPDLLNYG